MHMGRQIRVIQVDEEPVGDEGSPLKSPLEVLAEIIAATAEEAVEPASASPAYGESGPSE